MSPRALATMGVRLIAVYTLIPVATMVNYVFARGGLPPIDFIASPLALLVLGAVLWLAAPAIGGAINGSSEPLGGIGLDLRSFAQVGFGALGIVLAVLALGGLVQSVVGLLVEPAPVQGEIVRTTMFYGELAGTLVQVLLGAAVFLGRRVLANVVSAARNY